MTAEVTATAAAKQSAYSSAASPMRGLAITSGSTEWDESTDQLRTTTAELSAPQRSTMVTNEQWFTLDNRRGPIWGSRGREFKSRQPDITMAEGYA
jgi:hypothetical protein